ncbi:MAG: DUF5682 family protein [Promethearchaeota archaeon]
MTKSTEKNPNVPLDPDKLIEIFHILGDSIGIDPKKRQVMKSKYEKSKITYFPIRHHSPASSRFLTEYLTLKSPKLVFFEFPSDAQNEISFIAAKDTKPPIALYSFFKDDQNQLGLNGIFTPNLKIPKKFHAWYPLTQYSPEYVLISYCSKKKIPIYCIDAPFLQIAENQLKNSIIPMSGANSHYSEPLNEQSASQMSQFYEILADYFGNQSMEDIWDIIFEIPGQLETTDDYLKVFIEYCINLRLSTPDEIFEKEAIMFRENYMISKIKRLKKKYPKIPDVDILVVTGGLHSVILPQIASKTKVMPKSKLKSITSLIPFSFSRVSNLSGYSSGNWAPYYYNQLWENYLKFHSSASSSSTTFYEETYLESISTIFYESRQNGLLLSTADSIAVHQTSRLLASLRFRTFPNVRDIQEALILCCIKENPQTSNQVFQQIIMAYFIGTKIGAITKKYTKVGVQKDFYHKFENFGIELKDKTLTLELNLHQPKDRLMAEYFWQLDFLEIPGFSNINGTRDINSNFNIFKEKWTMQWSTKIDLKLLEISIYGTTIEECVINILHEKMSLFQNNVAKNASFLFIALKMGLSSQIGPLTNKVQKSVSLDRNFFHLVEAFFTILLIQKIAQTIPYTSSLPLIQLIQAHFYSICSEILNSTNPKVEDEDRLVQMVYQVTEIVLTNFSLGLNTSLYDRSLVTGYQYSNSYYIKGSLLGARYLLQTQTILQIKSEIENIFNSMVSIKLKFGQLIFGIVTVCKNRILFEKEFIQMLIDIIDSISWDQFLIILPGIRKAFTLLSQRDHEDISQKIAKILGVEKEEFMEEIQVTKNIMDSIKKIDKRVFEIIDNWVI